MLSSRSLQPLILKIYIYTLFERPPSQVLQLDGLLVEQDCLSVACQYLDRPCPFSWAEALTNLTIPVPCNNLTDTDLKLLSHSQQQLEPVALGPTDYCCQGCSSTSPFLQLMGSSCSFPGWASVAIYQETRCSTRFSKWVKGSCKMERRQVYRLCLVDQAGQGCVVKQYYSERCNSQGDKIYDCEGSTLVCSTL